VRLFHIVDRDVWSAAAVRGEYRPASLDTEGFVHFSFAGQVANTAGLHYRETPNLCVVEVDSSAFDHEVRVEDSYGSGTEFPHVYGPIPMSAAVAIHQLERGPTGDFSFTPGGAVDPAWPDR